MSAYSCRPGHGSERGVGWNWVKQMARFHEISVITRKCNTKAIDAHCQKIGLKNVTWIFYDLPYCGKFWLEGGRGVHLYYYLWQIGAYLKAKHSNKTVGVNLTHHLTYGVYWMPSFLAYLNIPFIWGPVGGAEAPPKSFLPKLRFKFRCFEKFRKLVQKIGELDPSVRRCIRDSAVVLTKAKETAQRLKEMKVSHVQIYPESGLNKIEIKDLGNIPTNFARPFRFFSMGRLLNWKQFDLGLKAFARFRQSFKDCEYWILGDGPEYHRLKCLANDLRIQDVTHFFGRVPRLEVFEKLASCHVLVHPSLHDSGGWVCLEAMAAGRPVICLDLGGPAMQVTEETGIKIDVVSPDQAVTDMTTAFLELANNPQIYKQMSAAGRKRVRDQFEWDKKGEWMNELWQSVSDKRSV